MKNELRTYLVFVRRQNLLYKIASGDDMKFETKVNKRNDLGISNKVKTQK